MSDAKNIIIMGTYNGERYIIPQLESIQNQNVQDWVLLIRDDGSTDHTVEIISKFAKNDKRIQVISNNNKNSGVINNFGTLMQEALRQNAGIVFFSDQDDVWLPDKLKNQIQAIEKLEQKYGCETPILIHSDLRVVDSNLKPIHESFMKYQGISHIAKNPLRYLLTQNFVTGCSTAINSNLLKISLPLPEDIIMHDWWLALCAAACGKLDFIKQPCLLYRQHENNAVGAKSLMNLYNFFGKEFADIWKNGKKHFLMTFFQAKSLEQRLKELKFNKIANEITLAHEYASCLEYDLGKRLRTIHNNRIRHRTLSHNIFMYVRLTLLNYWHPS